MKKKTNVPLWIGGLKDAIYLIAKSPEESKQGYDVTINIADDKQLKFHVVKDDVRIADVPHKAAWQSFASLKEGDKIKVVNKKIVAHTCCAPKAKKTKEEV